MHAHVAVYLRAISVARAAIQARFDRARVLMVTRPSKAGPAFGVAGVFPLIRVNARHDQVRGRARLSDHMSCKVRVKCGACEPSLVERVGDECAILF